jgi:hypothetical protein
VAHICARPLLTIEDYVRETLRLAREGLPVPVKDEAQELLESLLSPVDGGYKGYDASLATIRQFLATRDAERDVEVAELVSAAYYALNWIKVINHKDKRTANLSAALAKLEPKP